MSLVIGVLVRVFTFAMAMVGQLSLFCFKRMAKSALKSGGGGPVS